MTAVDLIRLYDFVAGNIIRSAEMDAELSQLVAANNKVVDDLTAFLAAGGAALVGFTPTADIASTTVQTAIEEVLVTAKDAQIGSILPGTLTTTELVQALARAAVASRVHDVGGTATAITTTDSDITVLYDNMPFNCIIGASNSAAATTLAIGALGAKPVYKVGTTSAPNLTAGKQASFWYDAGAGCFFLKASAEGTATVAQVLAGVPFSTEVDSGLVGTMTARTGDSAATDLQLSGSTLRLRPAEGHYDGVSDYVTNADGDRIAGNIMAGATFDGLTGTIVEKVGSATVITPSTADQVIPAGRYGGVVGDGKVLAVANASPGNIKSGVVIAGETGTYAGAGIAAGTFLLVNLSNTVSVTATTAYTKVREFTVNTSCTLRIYFNIMGNSSEGNYSAWVCRNGDFVGSPIGVAYPGTEVSTQDIAGWVAGDKLQLYLHTSVSYTSAINTAFTVGIVAPVV